MALNRRALTLAAGIGCLSAILNPAAAQDASSVKHDDIIWNDAVPAKVPPPQTSPAKTSPAKSVTPGNAPIRDSFAPGTDAAKALDKPVVSPLAAGPVCREFQQQIMIEGRLQPAHGRACQQPDGSWRLVN